MINQPLISVLMTAYNREKYIGEAIASVLASTYVNFELIVVDDCSRDRTVEIARSFESKDSRVKVYVNEKNLGDYPNRNQAATYAQGKYITYLDSDDIMYDYGLFFLVRFMEMFPEAGFGLASYFDGRRPYPVCIAPKEIYEEHFFGQFGHFSRSPGSGVIRLDVFRALNGFSGKKMVGDQEFWLKIARKHKLVKFSLDHMWSRIDNADRETAFEFASKANASFFQQLRNQVFIEALEHPECPLDTDQKKALIMKIKQGSFRKALRRLLEIVARKWNALW